MRSIHFDFIGQVLKQMFYIEFDLLRSIYVVEYINDWHLINFKLDDFPVTFLNCSVCFTKMDFYNDTDRFLQ